MKELKPDTAGNTPEPLICDYYGMKTPLRIGLTLRGPFVCARRFDNRGELQAKFTLDGKPIDTITLPSRVAAPSQEAAPQYYFPCCRRFYAHAENCRAEPAPSPATSEDEPGNYDWCPDCGTVHGANEDCPKPDAPSPATKDTPRNVYTMTFVLSADFQEILLLRKPDDHRNPLFRGKWTVPGGLVEAGESEMTGALRELTEETEISVLREEMTLVMRFPCNCDPLENEHDVVIYAITVKPSVMKCARGSKTEPLAICALQDLGKYETVAYLSPLLALVVERLKQPKATYAGVKSISQGPAREETLEKIITDILKLHGHPVTHNSKALARELFDAGAQSRTPTNLESRTVAPQPGGAYKAAAKFVELILGSAMEEWGGFDGDEIESAAIASGLIEQSPVTGSCGECCRCADYGFPTECNKLTISGKAVMNMAGKLVEGSESALAGAAALPSMPEITFSAGAPPGVASYPWGAPTTEFCPHGIASNSNITCMNCKAAASVPAASSPTKELEQCGPIKLDTNRAGHIFIDQDDKESPFGTRVILTPQQAMEVSQFIAKHYAVSSPAKDEHAVLQAALDWNEEYKFLNHLVGNPYWVAWANTLGMNGQYMPSPHTPKEMGHKPIAASSPEPNQEETREFEQSVDFVGYDFTRDGLSANDYEDRDTYHAWLGWIAARRARWLPAPPVASQPTKEIK